MRIATRTAAMVAASTALLGCPFAMENDFVVEPAAEVEPSPEPKEEATCVDGATNGDETDVDCGASCSPCHDDRKCGVGADCESGSCVGGVCRKPSCTDAVANGDETDVDCGGPCPGCAIGGACLGVGDCEASVCANGVCVSACEDGIKDAEESDIDCGSPACGPCPLGGICKDNADCESDHCSDHVCST